MTFHISPIINLYPESRETQLDVHKYNLTVRYAIWLNAQLTIQLSLCNVVGQ